MLAVRHNSKDAAIKLTKNVNLATDNFCQFQPNSFCPIDQQQNEAHPQTVIIQWFQRYSVENLRLAQSMR